MSVGNDDDDDDGDGDKKDANVSGLYKNPKETFVYLHKKNEKKRKKNSNEGTAILCVSPFLQELLLVICKHMVLEIRGKKGVKAVCCH